MPRHPAAVRLNLAPRTAGLVADVRVDYKRELGRCYSGTRTPVIIEIPELAFAMVDGLGDPNTSPAFSDAVGALYGVAYAAKFAVTQASGLTYAVMPLEGLWWTPEGRTFAAEDRSDWRWTVMIMQPAAVTADLFAGACAQAAARRPSDAVGRVRLDTYAEGWVAQVLHVGPYATEGPTIAGLHAFIADQGFVTNGKHHEIYLGDPRRAAPEKLKTIVRQPVVPRVGGGVDRG